MFGLQTLEDSILFYAQRLLKSIVSAHRGRRYQQYISTDSSVMRELDVGKRRSQIVEEYILEG